MERVTVEFLIGDIVHPDPAQVLRELYERTSLTGEVIGVTDDGARLQNLLIVQVPGLCEPVIIPATNARSCDFVKPADQPDATELRIATRGVQRGFPSAALDSD